MYITDHTKTTPIYRKYIFTCIFFSISYIKNTIHWAVRQAFVFHEESSIMKKKFSLTMTILDRGKIGVKGC